MFRDSPSSRRWSRDFTPERVAAAVGIDAAHDPRLARDFAAAPSAVCYGRMGLSTQAFGGLCQWLVNVLNILTGNLDRAGGAMFTDPGVRHRDAEREPASSAAGHSRVRGLPEFGGELPVGGAGRGDRSLPGEGQIRAW